MAKFHIKYFTVSFILLSLMLSHKLISQSFTYNPSKLYVHTIDTNSTDFNGIEIVNTGAQNLNLNWRLLEADTLIDSRFELCNSGICFMNLPNSGVMPTMAPGNTGWIKLHMYSGVATGTNTIKYLLRNGSTLLDTLVFKIIVSPNATGLKENNNIKQISLFPNPAVNETAVSINLVNTSDVTINVLNNVGQLVYQTASTLNAGSNKINIDTKNFASGIYNVIIASENGSVTKKLSVAK